MTENIKYNAGDRVIASGYEGVIVREYMPDYYEVRLPGGVGLRPAQELTPVEPVVATSPR